MYVPVTTVESICNIVIIIWSLINYVRPGYCLRQSMAIGIKFMRFYAFLICDIGVVAAVLSLKCTALSGWVFYLGFIEMWQVIPRQLSAAVVPAIVKYIDTWRCYTSRVNIDTLRPRRRASMFYGTNQKLDSVEAVCKYSMYSYPSSAWHVHAPLWRHPSNKWRK